MIECVTALMFTRALCVNDEALLCLIGDGAHHDGDIVTTRLLLAADMMLTPRDMLILMRYARLRADVLLPRPLFYAPCWRRPRYFDDAAFTQRAMRRHVDAAMPPPLYCFFMLPMLLIILRHAEPRLRCFAAPYRYALRYLSRERLQAARIYAFAPECHDTAYAISIISRISSR